MKVTLKKHVENRIRASARKGARKLDSILPNWYTSNNVSLKKLDQTNSCFCVWGQLETKHGDKIGEVMGNLDSSVPGYFPMHDPSGEQDHVDPRCEYIKESCWSTEANDQRHAVMEEEWRILQDEWEAQIRIRRGRS